MEWQGTPPFSTSAGHTEAHAVAVFFCNTGAPCFKAGVVTLTQIAGTCYTGLMHP